MLILLHVSRETFLSVLFKSLFGVLFYGMFTLLCQFDVSGFGIALGL